MWMPRTLGPHDQIAEDVAIARVVVQIEAVAARIDDAVETDDMALARGGAGLGVAPAVDCAGIAGPPAGAVEVVVFDDISAHPAAAEIDAVMGRVVDRVVSDDVVLGKRRKHAGRVVDDLAAVVDVVVEDLVEERILQVRFGQAEVVVMGRASASAFDESPKPQAAAQADAVAADVCDLVVADHVPGVVPSQVNAVAAGGVDPVLLHPAPLGAVQVDRLAAILRPLHREHRRPSPSTLSGCKSSPSMVSVNVNPRRVT